MSNRLKIICAAGLAVVATTFAASSCASAETGLVLAPPRVTQHAAEISLRHGPALLVRSLTVFHESNVNVRVACPGCRRLRSNTPRQRQPRPEVTRYTALEWIVRRDQHVQIQVTRPGATGRYLVLGVLRPLGEHALVVTASGCLDRRRGRIKCPAAAQTPGSTLETYAETAGGEAHTWTDYHTAGGTEGQPVGANQTVQVTCRVQGYEVPDGDTWWYRLASEPWNGAYYATADAFYNNGETSGSLSGTPFFDPKVREC